MASTKAFTTQLVGLFLLALTLAKTRARLSAADEAAHLKALRHLPAALQAVLALEPQIISWASQFASKENALFLGRGLHYPIAQEGALKLKEISYIHAEGYPAAEMKHGPIALVDTDLPVLFVATHHQIHNKIISNMQEVKARGGHIISIVTRGDEQVRKIASDVIEIPQTLPCIAPLLSVIPLQLLAYHVAVQKGLNVDQPRNLAKSVTVE